MGTGGPQTPEGKAVARMNATRHGINSNSPVIAGLESEEDWEAHRSGLIDSLQPVGSLELLLAERVALQSWRLLRVLRYEREVVDTEQEKVKDDLAERLESERSRLLSIADSRADVISLVRYANIDPETRHSIDSQFPAASDSTAVDRRARWQSFLQRERLLPGDVTLNKIMRYEAHLSRQFYQALHELEALQTRRTGGVAPLARLDVHGIPDQTTDS